MAHSLLFEVNTRCWLRALSDKLGRPVSLATVPEEEFAFWEDRHFTHVWLMGVWSTGQKTRELARAQPGLRALSAEAFGARGDEELVSSPYAVADYTAAEALGGAAALRKFRDDLRRHGLALVLDFVPNHLGLDHRWLSENPALFVRSATPKPETFPVATASGTVWIAHGKDPYFPAWTDTAQLDYRQAATRRAMIEILQSVAAQCDGARCDTAMLALNDIIDKTWAHFPSGGPAPAGEFWVEAISAVRKQHPRFVFIAEAYWDTEPRLQSLGFDCVYDKKFYEFVTRRDWPALQGHIRAVAARFNPARFLENHDEPQVASALNFAEQKAAAVLLLAQPGMRLAHDGQLAGLRRHTPVQFARYWPETPNPELAAFYDRLFAALQKTAIGRGEVRFCQTGVPHCFAIQWQEEAGAMTLALVNMAQNRTRFQLRDIGSGWEIRTIHADPHSTWAPAGGGLQVNLAACGFQLLELRRAEG